MVEQDQLHLMFPGHILGSSLCCNNLQKEVCVLLFADIHGNKIGITHNFKEKNLESSAVELETEVYQSY
jgi:hypothetical protein